MKTLTLCRVIWMTEINQRNQGSPMVFRPEIKEYFTETIVKFSRIFQVLKHADTKLLTIEYFQQCGEP